VAARTRLCKSVTCTGNVLPFFLCSPEFMIGFAGQAYAVSRVTGLLVNAFLGRADMPAYIHHHDDMELAFVICPSCVGLPMFVRDVEPHWSMAKIDFTYECAVCGAEIKQTIVKPQLRH
jgi:hypothetical protein